MYHDVAEEEKASGFRVSSARPYQLALPRFVAHLEAVGQGPLPPRTVFDFSSDRNGLLLTFDDGGESAMRVSELLDARGWKGHFFVTTGFIGKAGFVSRNDVLDLHRRGHVVGSHSHTHPNICYNLREEEMLDEWRMSCNLLGDILGAPVTTASVPGGDMDRRTVATAAQAGIRHLFTSEPTFTPWRDSEITCFGRVCVMHDTPPAAIERFIRFKGFGRQMAIRRSKQFIKRLVGPLYRRRVPRSYGPTTEPKSRS
jgi:peptidoglycan/xylan/chitin deacetylase (PgdA/CDA1 family)